MITDFTPIETIDVRAFQSELDKYKGYALEADGLCDCVSIRSSFDEAYFDHYGERHLSLKSGDNVATLSFVKGIARGTIPGKDCAAYEIVCKGLFTKIEQRYYLICN